MNPDGTNRRRLCGFGSPFWSPDGTQILVNSFSDPTVSELCSVRTGGTTRINVPGQEIFSWPRWAGPGQLVACIGNGAEPDAIVLLDVSRPDHARMLETLWQRSRGPDVYPRWPLFVAGTGDCYFVGVKGDLRTLYMISQKSGDTGHVYEVEGAGHVDELGGLSLSPDGRYLLFGANRPDREQAPSRVPGAVWNHAARSADQLAEVLKANPPQPSTPDGRRMQLYLRDLQDGGTMVIADEPVAGLTRTSSPCWSNDGRRIAFHATPQNDWGRSRLLVLRALNGKPVIDDLGHGSSPAFGPGDESIAFLIWPGASTGEQPGVWIMQPDGTERRRLTDLGAPFWSPDGEWIMINHFGDPTECRLRHLATGKEETVRVAGHQLWSWPRWVGPDRIVAVIRKSQDDGAIALLDVTKPAAAEIVKILWTRSPALDVLPRWPLYRATTGETLFVGVTSPNFRNLYRLSANSAGRAEPLQGRPLQDQLEGLFLSPGERYLLFNANRPDRELPSRRTPVSTRNDPAVETLRLADAFSALTRGHSAY
jgi:Tol biopolymer transport system component